MKKSLLLLSLTVAFAMQASAQDFSVDGLDYSVSDADNNEVAVSGYEGNDLSGDLDIPSTVDYNGTTYTVTSINNQAFMSCSGLSSIYIPSTVKSVGIFAFWNCTGVTELTLEDGVENIGFGAFQYLRALKQLNIPGSVTTISDQAFMGDSSITDVTIDEGVTSIGSKAFGWCYGLKNINIPASVNSLADFTFEECRSLENVTVNWETPLSISYFVFDQCDVSKCNLWVPAESVNAYKSASVWQGFQIVPQSTSGINGVSVNAGNESEHKGAPEIYSINGSKVQQLVHGINILKYPDGSTRKLIKK